MSFVNMTWPTKHLQVDGQTMKPSELIGKPLKLANVQVGTVREVSVDIPKDVFNLRIEVTDAELYEKLFGASTTGTEISIGTEAAKPIDWDEQRRIHTADCMDVKGRPSCGYECLTCGLCTKWSHGRHKALPCPGHG